MDTIATPDVSVDSSPTTITTPRDLQARSEWLRTGTLPEEKPSSGDSATSEESSAASDKPAGKAAPASEAGKNSQEKKTKPRDSAGTRADELRELLDEFRSSGLTPSEIKAWRESQKSPQQQAEPPKQAAPEHTAKPAGDLKAPTKPKVEDFETYEKYEAAKDQYYEDLTDFKAAKSIRDWQQQQHDNAAKATLHQKMQDAKTRYGEEAIPTISATARTISGDEQISPPVKSILDGSPVMVDVLYVLGSDAGELAQFVQLARNDPGAAIRKLVTVEGLVQAELAKGSGGKKAAAADESTAERDESGKFVKAKSPDKKESDAPPPPKEVSGRGAPPPDEVERAVKDGDFQSFFRAENAREIARRRGH